MTEDRLATGRRLLRWLVREMRGAGGRVLFFLLCLSVGVAAVVSVRALSASLDAGVRANARELIAADIVVSGGALEPADLEALRAALGETYPAARVVPVVEMFAVVSLPGAAAVSVPGLPLPGLAAVASSSLVELKAVGPGYPLYGEAEVDPPAALRELHGAGGPRALVAPELVDRLGLAVGDGLALGTSVFEVAGVIRSEPDRLGGSLSLGPRVLISHDAVTAANLLNDVSRTSRSTLIGIPEDADVEAVAAFVADRLPPGRVRVETYREARPELRRALSQMAAFLGLVALLSLLVGGVGVAQTVRAWMATAWDQIAVLKSLGAPPREILLLYTGQVLVLAVAGSALGCVVGVGIQFLLPLAWGDLLPPGLVRPWQPWPVAQGFLLGLVVALAFSLPALLVVLRVSAARVLRRDSQPLAPRRSTSVLLSLGLVATVLLVATWQAAGMRLHPLLAGGGFTLLLLLTVAGLVVAARLLVWGVTRVRGLRRGGGLAVAWRYGVSSVARPGAGTLSAVVALGLGILVVLTMVLMERALSEQLRNELPRDAPSMFLLGIREDQWPELSDVLEGREAGGAGGDAADAATVAGERVVRSVPVLMTRVVTVDGETVDEREEAEQGDRWAQRRRLRVTTLADLPEDNSLVEGAWFRDDGRWEASLEREFAESLGVGVGSRLELAVGDETRELVVTSLREVRWESFSINFFVVVEPGTFAPASGFRLATVRLPREGEQALQDVVAARFPGVTVIRVSAALEKAAEIIGRLSWGVRFLGLFTVVAALVILTGAVAATASRRNREAALLKSLGMTRWQVLLAFGTEVALLGLVASLVAVLGASLASWVAATFALEIPWRFRPLLMAGAMAAGVGLAILGGLAASAGAVRRRPIEALRSE